MTPDANSTAKAVDMLDLLLEFFEGGKYWMTKDLIDDAENRWSARCASSGPLTTFMAHRPAITCCAR